MNEACAITSRLELSLGLVWGSIREELVQDAAIKWYMVGKVSKGRYLATVDTKEHSKSKRSLITW
jgi:hypothetical protein